MNLLRVAFIVLLSWNICLQEKLCCIMLICVLQITIKNNKIKWGREAIGEFRLRKIDETRDYLSDEIKHNDSMSEKYKKKCKYLNYVKNLLILVSAATGCVSENIKTLKSKIYKRMTAKYIKPYVRQFRFLRPFWFSITR